MAQTLETYTEGFLKGVQTKEGARITEALFTDVYFYEKHRYISVRCGDKWGCLDWEGLPITEIKYDRIVTLDRARSQKTQKIFDDQYRLSQRKAALPSRRR